MATTLGSFVSELRKKRGLRQSDLAEKLGYSTQAISKFENDDSAFPVSSFPMLGNLLGVSLDSFFTLQEQNESNPPFNESLFVANLKALRLQEGKSLTQEAAFLGVAKNTLIKYEKGEALPPYEVTQKLIEQSKSSPHTFFYSRIGSSSGGHVSSKKHSHRLAFFLALIVLFLLGGGSFLTYRLLNQDAVSSQPSAEVSSPSSSFASSSVSSASSSEEELNSTLPGLEQFWVQDSTGRLGKNELYANAVYSLLIFSLPYDYFVTNSAHYKIRFELSAGTSSLVSLQEGKEPATAALSVGALSAGTTFSVFAYAYNVDYPDSGSYDRTFVTTVE